MHFNENKFEPVLVPYNISAQKVCSSVTLDRWVDKMAGRMGGWTDGWEGGWTMDG